MGIAFYDTLSSAGLLFISSKDNRFHSFGSLFINILQQIISF